MPQDSVLLLLTTCLFMVMEYFKVQMDVSLLIRCMNVLGPWREVLALVNDCIFLHPSKKNKEKIIFKRFVLS